MCLANSHLGCFLIVSMPCSGFGTLATVGITLILDTCTLLFRCISDIFKHNLVIKLYHNIFGGSYVCVSVPKLTFVWKYLYCECWPIIGRNFCYYSRMYMYSSDILKTYRSSDMCVHILFANGTTFSVLAFDIWCVVLWIDKWIIKCSLPP